MSCSFATSGERGTAKIIMEWNEIEVEGLCIRCETAEAKHVSGFDGKAGYGWCDDCMGIINAEDARGLAAGTVDAEGFSFIDAAGE